jgi:hypothetical protein
MVFFGVGPLDYLVHTDPRDSECPRTLTGHAKEPKLQVKFRSCFSTGFRETHEKAQVSGL